eukprot:m.7467 g.7467  ORF g.7467 m.7467 type:complete len:89 (-) comp2810_c0_seq1:612-878(-)
MKGWQRARARRELQGRVSSTSPTNLVESDAETISNEAWNANPKVNIWDQFSAACILLKLHEKSTKKEIWDSKTTEEDDKKDGSPTQLL